MIIAHRDDGFQGHVAALDDPFVSLFQEYGSN